MSKFFQSEVEVDYDWSIERSSYDDIPETTPLSSVIQDYLTDAAADLSSLVFFANQVEDSELKAQLAGIGRSMAESLKGIEAANTKQPKVDDDDCCGEFNDCTGCPNRGDA